MDWVKLATRYYTDPKIRALDDAAELMFVRGLARAGELASGGFIPESDVGLLARRRRYETLVSALVASRLWSRVDGGYRITAWADWQSAADALAARRTADRERQQKRRAALSRDNGNVSRDVTPIEKELEKEGGSSRSSTSVARARDPEPPRQCETHQGNPNAPNCGRCKAARQQNEAWHAQRRARLDAAPRCAKHPDWPAHSCGPCRSERIGRT